MYKTFDNYLFRCSSLGRIMVGAPKSLTKAQEEIFAGYQKRHRGDGKPLTPTQEKQFFEWGARKTGGGELSAGVKNYLKEIHRAEIFNRETDLQSKYLNKGIEVEETAFSLYSDVKGTLLLKNKRRFNNAFITGEPDNLFYKVRDFKSSWDLSTFPMYDATITNKMYYWQLQGYMHLTGYKKAELIYCLVDTPERLINDELRRTSWALGYVDLPATLEQKVIESLTFGDIPKRLRIKALKVNYNPGDCKKIEARVKLCRQYLNGLNRRIATELTTEL